MALPPFKGSGTGARPRVGRRVRVGPPVRVKGMVHVRTNHWHGQHHSDLQFEYCKPPSLDIPVVSLGGHGLLRFGFKRDELDGWGPIDCTEHALEAGNALPQGNTRASYGTTLRKHTFFELRAQLVQRQPLHHATRPHCKEGMGWGLHRRGCNSMGWDGVRVEEQAHSRKHAPTVGTRTMQPT